LCARANAPAAGEGGGVNELFSSAFFFIVALGLLVTAHEYGHFVVARALGVKVLRFSIGFGKPLWRRRRGPDEIEYVVSALPLGGYVQMLDEREGPVADRERHRAFNRQTLGRRAAIVTAGPLFNFLFAIVAYWIAFVAGVTGIKPIIGDVVEGSLAARGGFHDGDLIVSIAGQPVPTWRTAFLDLLDRSLSRQRVAIEVVTADGQRQDRELDFSQLRVDSDRTNLLADIGFDLYRPTLPAVIGRVESRGAAERAGLKAGDRIVEADGRSIHGWDDWVKVVRENPGKDLAVTITRGNENLSLTLRPDRVETPQGPVGRIGAAVEVPPDFGEEMRTVERYSVPSGLAAAVQRTGDMSRLTFNILINMVSGNVGISNLGGPLRIAQYAGSSAEAGAVEFISFLALISISLGVLNLLPIPVLDGGHLLYYLIEAVRGRPLSEHTQLLGQRIGIAVLVLVMIVAFYNDIIQIFG
jgi:regulator of sigma E protease